jgi:ribosomal protein S15P/S13E
MSKVKDKAKLERKIARMQQHIQKHPRDGASQRHLAKKTEALGSAAYRKSASDEKQQTLSANR